MAAKLDSATLGEIADMVASRLSAGVAPVAVSGAQEGERALVVCTTLRGIFFGYAKDSDMIRDASGMITGIKLRSARNAFYYTGTKGFMDLGATGPGKGSKIGPRADIELAQVSCVIECDPVAVAKWEAETWA